mmetsp:Transcript_18825/g.39508  ORF Transcript_18825/g.39508 Transcript_18825/m.39508 type:complete len:113 (+) Transcript_18825:54-392(+)
MPYAYVNFKASLFFIHPNWRDWSSINKKSRVHFQVRSPTNSIATMMGRKHPKKAPLCAGEVPIASLKGRDMNSSDDAFALVINHCVPITAALKCTNNPCSYQALNFSSFPSS